MRGGGSAIFLMCVAIWLAGCTAVSTVPGATLLYTRILTDSEGKKTAFRAHDISNPDQFSQFGIDPEENYAAAGLEFVLPTYMIIFNPLPGKSIRHTKDLSKVVPLLARELCGENDVGSVQRELNWETSERNVYIECQALFGLNYNLGGTSSASRPSGTKVDPEYVMEYRVIFDANQDPMNATVKVFPDGKRTVTATR